MAKIIVGAAMLVAGIALMIYCGPMGAAAMMALYGAIASTGFSMVLGGIAQKLQGQYSPAIGIAVKQPASPWNVVYGRSRIGGVIAGHKPCGIAGDKSPFCSADPKAMFDAAPEKWLRLPACIIRTEPRCISCVTARWAKSTSMCGSAWA